MPHLLPLSHIIFVYDFIGRILDNNSLLSDHGIDEKKFIVIMVTKPKTSEPVQPQSTPAAPVAPVAQPLVTPAPAPAAVTTAPASNVEGPNPIG